MVSLSSKKLNVMKKLFVVVLLLATTVAVQAQEKRIPGFRGHRPPPHLMQEKLKFSEEQKQKVKALNEDFRKKMMDLRKNEDITVKEWKSRIQALHKKHRDDMQALLSTEQKAQIEKMKLERKQMADINARARMERMKLRLDLSKEQAEKMEKQRTGLMQKMKALHENQALDREKKREQIKELIKKHREEMKSILTEEQQKKIEEMKKHHPRKPGKLS